MILYDIIIIIYIYVIVLIFVFIVVVGAIERVSSAKYGIIFAGVCGVAGAIVVLPVAIVKARKAREAEAMTLGALVVGEFRILQTEKIKSIFNSVSSFSQLQFIK